MGIGIEFGAQIVGLKQVAQGLLERILRAQAALKAFKGRNAHGQALKFGLPLLVVLDQIFQAPLEGPIHFPSLHSPKSPLI